MSAKDDMDWKDTVDLVLRGPDGKIKTTRSTKKVNPIVFLIALILFIPISIYRILFKQGK